MSPGPTFDRVYAALKSQLVGGHFAPGEHLEPAVLADSLAASITPIRDALHRLVGERIVEAPRHNGFRVPSPTEAELRDLYLWNQLVLEAALRRFPKAGSPAGDAAPEGSPETQTAAELFLAIGERGGGGELGAAIARLNDRLGPFRSAEALVIDDGEEEIADLARAFHGGDRSGLRLGIAAYHRRRQRVTPTLLVAARRAGCDRGTSC